MKASAGRALCKRCRQWLLLGVVDRYVISKRKVRFASACHNKRFRSTVAWFSSPKLQALFSTTTTARRSSE